MLGDAIAQALPGLRLNAESVMRDTALVSATGAATFDPDTGQTTNTPIEVYYGPARLRMPSSMVESSSVFGDVDVTKQRFILSVPHDVTGIELDHVVTMIESDDPSALDREFRVISIPSRSFPIERAFGLETVE